MLFSFHMIDQYQQVYLKLINNNSTESKSTISLKKLY